MRSRGPPGAATSSDLPVETHRQSTVPRPAGRGSKQWGSAGGRGRGGLLFTWCADPIVVGGMVWTNGPHEAEHAAAKHGGQEGVKCSVEEQDEAWRAGEEQQSRQHQETLSVMLRVCSNQAEEVTVPFLVCNDLYPSSFFLSKYTSPLPCFHDPPHS